MSLRDDRERQALLWLALVLVLGSALVLWPFGPWLVAAMWAAVFARRVHAPLTRLLGDRPRIAAILTMLGLALFVVPAVALVSLLVADAIDLVNRVMASERAQEILRQLVSGDDRSTRSSSDLVAFAMSQGERAWAIVQQIAGTAVHLFIGLVILIAGTYTILIDGERWYSWTEHHVPISAQALRRLTDAFVETGRGLFVGSVGAGLAQAAVATIIYVSLGLPQPFALGLLTLVGSVVPVIGTAIVWLPVAAGLAMTGRTGAAIVLAVAGIALISTVDNLVRPYLARRGRLQLPALIIFVAMFGGITIMGIAGVLVAPLVVRLAKEALAIVRDQRVVDLPPASPSIRPAS